jgi:hypothetical protein
MRRKHKQPRPALPCVETTLGSARAQRACITQCCARLCSPGVHANTPTHTQPYDTQHSACERWSVIHCCIYRLFALRAKPPRGCADLAQGRDPTGDRVIL